MPNPTVIGTRNHDHHHSSHSEDDDESLSLSDLPLLSSPRHQEDENEQRQDLIRQSESKPAPTEDFDFGSLSASLDALESEMCVADEVFFRGQILPFRHSVSSASTTTITTNSIPRSVSRSESMDRVSGFRGSASTSRSSSTRSSSINSSASADKLSHRHSNFTHNRASKVIKSQSAVSARPYGGAPSGPRRSTSSAQSPIKKSALWEFFRLGLVQTPEIELEDLKFRYSKNHGSGNGKSVNKESSGGELELELEGGKKKKKKGGMGLMKSCKCSVEAVEPEKGKRKQQVTRHHRTFEWLRDLSHAVVLNDV